VIENELLTYELEKADEWRKWMLLIPFIEWPSGWKVRACPPFSGAIVRYHVQTPKMNGEKFVSVYLDCYDRIGYYGEPYWEVYPHEGDVGRCAMANVTELLKLISEAGL